jgi:ubiquinone/menaquinone biosynthesis C-methylase UbiE
MSKYKHLKKKHIKHSLRPWKRYIKYYENLIRIKGSKCYILDIGCGRGNFLKKFPNSFGIDINKKDLRYAKKFGQRICLANASHLPFKDKTFDILHLKFIVEHLKNVKKAFIELKRISRKDCIIIIITTNLLNPLVFVKSILPGKIRAIHNPSHKTYHKANTLCKLSRMMTILGFDKIVACMWTNRLSN